jgi:lysophospholipase L1-like esterase
MSIVSVMKSVTLSRVGKPKLIRLFLAGMLVLGSVLFSLVLVEAALRVFPDLLPVEVQKIIRADPRDYGVVHPYIGHLHKPNNALIISGRDFRAVHHTDGYGFRNNWPWPNTADILVLGDSVTFGQGVEDEQAWPAIIARSFPKHRLVNLGLIGAGPQQYLRVYETFGLNLRPKLVLIGFFMGNDFWDAEMFDSWLKSGAGGSYLVWRDFGRPRSTSLSLQQPLRNLVSSIVWRAKLLARKAYVCNLLLYLRGDFSWSMASGRRTFKAADGTRLVLGAANNLKTAQTGHPVFEMVLNALQRIDFLAKENGAKILVVLQRSKEEVYLPFVGVSVPDAAAPLRTALTKRGIPHLDLLDEFRRHAAKGEALFFETDGHPNARGYALIAELISSYLKEHSEEFGL